MAWSVTGRGQEHSGTSAVQTESVGAFTPTADSFLMVGGTGQMDTTGQPNQPTNPVSGGSLTFTEQENYEGTGAPQFGTQGYALNSGVWTSPIGASPSSMTITYDPGESTFAAYMSMAIIDVTGHDTASVVAQTKKNSAADLGPSSSASLSVTLDSTPTVGNAVFVYFGSGADSGGGFATPTLGGRSMTEVYNRNGAYTQDGWWWIEVDGTETDNTVSCSDLGQDVGNAVVFALELNKEAASGTPMGDATETDTARLLVAAKDKATGQTTETDTARAVAGTKTRTLSRPGSTEAARSMAAAKVRTLSQVGSTALARAVAAAKTRTFSRGDSTETARPFTVAKARTIGQATEGDTARTFNTPSRLAQTTEADSAGSVTAAKARTLSQSNSTETARSLVVRRLRTLSRIDSAETARSFVVQKTRTLGQATEADSATAMATPAGVGLGQVAEADSAGSVTAAKTRTLSRPDSTETARSLTAVRRLAIGAAAAVESALPIVARKTRTLSRPDSTETARRLIQEGAALAPLSGFVYLTLGAVPELRPPDAPSLSAVPLELEIEGATVNIDLVTTDRGAGAQRTITVVGAPDLTGATVEGRLRRHRQSATVTATVASATTVTVDFESWLSTNPEEGPWSFELALNPDTANEQTIPPGDPDVVTVRTALAGG